MADISGKKSLDLLTLTTLALRIPLRTGLSFLLAHDIDPDTLGLDLNNPLNSLYQQWFEDLQARPKIGSETMTNQAEVHVSGVYRTEGIAFSFQAIRDQYLLGKLPQFESSFEDFERSKRNYEKINTPLELSLQKYCPRSSTDPIHPADVGRTDSLTPYFLTSESHNPPSRVPINVSGRITIANADRLRKYAR